MSLKKWPGASEEKRKPEPAPGGVRTPRQKLVKRYSVSLVSSAAVLLQAAPSAQITDGRQWTLPPKFRDDNASTKVLLPT